MCLQNSLINPVLKDSNMMKHPSRLFVLMVASVLLAGCATPSPAPDKAPTEKVQAPAKEEPPVVVTAPAVSPPELPIAPSEGEKKLASAIAAFDRGEYALVIRQLTPLVTDNTLDKTSQLRALKSLAFSQCVSRALTACRQSFERAFRLDGKFNLAPAEQGHPVWGPQFERARKAVTGQKGK